MLDYPPGLILVTDDRNPLQHAILAPYLHVEKGRTFIRKKADERIDMFASVHIDQREVIYKISSQKMDYVNGRMTLESQWCCKFDYPEPRFRYTPLGWTVED